MNDNENGNESISAEIVAMRRELDEIGETDRDGGRDGGNAHTAHTIRPLRSVSSRRGLMHLAVDAASGEELAIVRGCACQKTEWAE